MNITELIIFITAAVVFTAEAALVVFFALRVRKIRKDLIQSEIDKIIFVTQLER